MIHKGVFQRVSEGEVGRNEERSEPAYLGKTVLKIFLRQPSTLFPLNFLFPFDVCGISMLCPGVQDHSWWLNEAKWFNARVCWHAAGEPNSACSGHWGYTHKHSGSHVASGFEFKPLSSKLNQIPYKPQIILWNLDFQFCLWYNGHPFHSGFIKWLL